MKPLSYIDQNIVQDVYENNIELPIREDIQYIYSDEHFNEMNRSNCTDFLNALEKLSARKIQINLDDQYRIVDSCTVYDYINPKTLFDEYIENTCTTPVNSFDFGSLQTFFYGNRNSLNIDDFIDNYRSTLINLLSDITSDPDCPIDCTPISDFINVQSEQFRETLLAVSKTILPLGDSRELISKYRFSNLNPNDGSIIDQIWDKLEIKPADKDSFFGKTPAFKDPKYDTWPRLLAISQCHSILNYLGYWPDSGLTKPSKIYGINSDASHIGHAAFCSFLISADDRLCKKASAIYNYFDISTIVLQVIKKDTK